MKHPWIEAGKDLLIVVLLLLTVLQTLYIITPGSFSQLPGIRRLYEVLNPETGISDLSVQETAVSEAVRPTALSVNTDRGRTSWQYSAAATDGAYESLGRWLGEALGTAGPLETISDEAWLQALSQTGVFYRFPGQVPVSALTQWLGAAWTQSSQGLALRDFAVCIQDETVRLCLSDGQTRYGCSTQISAAALDQALTDYGGDGSLFAFEGAETYAQLADLAADTLLTLSSLTLSRVQVQTAYSQEEFAVALGLNPYGDTGYTAADGSRVFADSSKRLRMQGAQISCTGTGLLTADDSSDPALTEAARTLLEDLTGSLLGDARLVLTALDRAGDTTVLTFSYLVDGVPVVLQGTAAAQLTFSGASLTRLDLAIRSFTLTEETVTVLSALQAASLLAPGQGLELVYAEDGSEILQCGWRAVTQQEGG